MNAESKGVGGKISSSHEAASGNGSRGPSVGKGLKAWEPEQEDAGTGHRTMVETNKRGPRWNLVGVVS